MYTTHHFKTLAEMVVRHGYFLDDGDIPFDEMLSPELKEKALNRYFLEDVLELVPLSRTLKEVQGLRMMLRKTQHGFRLVARIGDDVKPVIRIDDTTNFVFALKIRHALFPFFTDCVCDPKRIYLFANGQPAQLATNVKTMQQTSATEYVDSTYLLSEADSLKLLNAWTLPEERYGMLGLVSLSMKGKISADDLLDGDGKVPAAPLSFKAHFKTQQTFWTYWRNGEKLATTKTKRPLTKYGYIPVVPTTDLEPEILPGTPKAKYAYPNPLLETFEKDENQQLHSVIFI